MPICQGQFRFRKNCQIDRSICCEQIAGEVRLVNYDPPVWFVSGNTYRAFTPAAELDPYTSCSPPAAAWMFLMALGGLLDEI